MNPKAQITHAKSRLSERGEYVPDGDEIISLKTEIEQFLRIKGWSRRAARAGIHAFFKGLTDGMSDDPPLSEELAERQSPKSPDEIEVDAGLSTFKESLLKDDIDKAFRRIFHG